MNDYRFASPNVVSISSVCDAELAESIHKSDYIRNETLRRCMAIASYRFKSLAWKNRYYDLIRSKVIAELG